MRQQVGTQRRTNPPPPPRSQVSRPRQQAAQARRSWARGAEGSASDNGKNNAQNTTTRPRRATCTRSRVPRMSCTACEHRLLPA